jgi:ketosteroid isomerase-like protein
MSEENVELVRRFYEASQRSLDAYWRNRRSGLTAPGAGDLDPELEAVLSFLDPEVAYNAVPAVLWGGTARGHLGYLRSWDAFLGATEEFSTTVNEVADLGGDEVFVAVEMTARFRGSGMKLSEPRFGVVTVRDGLIVRLTVRRDRAEALEAAGLQE